MKYTIELVNIEAAETFHCNVIFKVLLDGIKVESLDSVAAFYSHLKLEQIPNFLFDSLNRTGSYAGDLSFYIGPIDDVDLSLTEQQVCIWSHASRSVIPLEDFLFLNFQLALRSLEANYFFKLLEKNQITIEWVEQIMSFLKIRLNLKTS